ncbi:MAG: uridine diphosphate-N-acetylglucosamine-binding protein YvcK [Thermoflexales bacterium]|nr:uridine diphosphate-N-acetylglucosamine-binding protein YvcK [Thermoflexales bacterium]
MTNVFLRATSRLRRWFVVGLGVKRWLLVMLIGLAMLGLGIGYVLVQLYRNADLPDIFYYLTLQFLPRLLRAVLFGGLGIAAFAIGFARFNATLLDVARGNDRQPLIDKLWRQRIGAQGPRVVAIGGGHGLSTLLRGLKPHTANITAIVTVADDGGSSGRLRREYGVLPPGDFRMCIAALADDESLVTQLFQYRFGDATQTGSPGGLSGHSFGNLFIAAMAGLTGSFETAVLESSRVVASQGRILPSTLSDVTLCAEYARSPDAMREGPARGESAIGRQGAQIDRVWLEPNNPPAFPDAVRAILDADIVTIGPGSLFTSVLPNVLVSGISDALRRTTAPVVYICNVGTEPGETEGFSVDDHVAVIERHIGRGIVDYVVAQSQLPAGHDAAGKPALVPPPTSTRAGSAAILAADVADDASPDRHDARKLGEIVTGIIRGNKVAPDATTHIHRAI